MTNESIAFWAPGCEGTKKDLLARSAAGGGIPFTCIALTMASLMSTMFTGAEAQRRVKIRLTAPKDQKKKEEGPMRVTFPQPLERPSVLPSLLARSLVLTFRHIKKTHQRIMIPNICGS